MQHTIASLTLAQLQHIDPIEFERMVGEVFKSKGYTFQMTPISGDGGVDLFVRRRSEYAIVQCKRLGDGKWVGRPTVQQLYGTLKHHEEIDQVNRAYLVTTGFFSNDAREFAKGKSIVLIEGKQLKQWAQQNLALQTVTAFSQSIPTSINRQTDYGSSKPGHNRRDKYSATRRRSNLKNISIVLITGVSLISLISIFSPSASTTQDTGRVTRQFVSMTAAPITDLGTFLQSQLGNLNGVKSVDQVRTVKSADGYTIFVSATIAREYQDVNLAKAMVDIAKGPLDATMIQFIAYFDDSKHVVTYVWSSRDNKWQVSSRNK